MHLTHCGAMSVWQGFYYPEVATSDVARELYVTSLGRIVYPPSHPPPS